MNITNEMINEELRLPQYPSLNVNTKEEFIKQAKAFKGMVINPNALEVQNLICTEKFISRKKDGSKLKLYIYKSPNNTKKVPGVLWIHGGGYAMGSPEQSISLYKLFIDNSDCIIIAPDYTLSIDKPYPAALDDCYESLLWLKNNANELNIKDDQIMVGGESAGGGLTAALTLYARDKKEVNIAFQMPLYPEIDDRMITESAKENNAPIWNSTLNRFAWQTYLGDLYGKDVPIYAAAARATDYKNLPPTVSFVGDIEPFKDETIQYIKNLTKANVPTHFNIYKGCYHGFDRLIPNAKISKDATEFLMNSFKFAVNNYFAKQTDI